MVGHMSINKIKKYQSILQKSYIYNNVQKTMINLNVDSIFDRLEIDDDSEFKVMASDISAEIGYLILHI